MARFVYQPIPEDMQTYSKHGQVISNVYSGHISLNHNNIIISATKRIENKIEDVFQIESNIIEQKNVINNLRDDLYLLSNNKYEEMYKELRDIQIQVATTKGLVSYIKIGIGGTLEIEESIIDKMIKAIHFARNQYQSAADIHKKAVAVSNDIYTGSSKLFHGYNLTDYISIVSSEISDQQATIELVKTNVEARLTMYLYYDY